MIRQVDTDTKNASTDRSAGTVDAAILNALASGPKGAGKLKGEVIKSTKCSRPQYYKRLAVLRDDLHKIVFVASGEKRYYALPQDKDRLIQYQKDGGDLQYQVIEDARYLRNYMMREARYDTDGKYLSTSVNVKFDYFLDTVRMLRRTSLGLPELKCAELEKPEEERDDAAVLRDAYRYVLEILDHFKAL